MLIPCYRSYDFVQAGHGIAFPPGRAVIAALQTSAEMIYSSLPLGDIVYLPVTAAFNTCVLKNPPFVRSMTCWYTLMGG